MMPLKYLMQDNPIKETAQTQSEEKPGCRWKPSSIVCASMIHTVCFLSEFKLKSGQLVYIFMLGNIGSHQGRNKSYRLSLYYHVILCGPRPWDLKTSESARNYREGKRLLSLQSFEKSYPLKARH